jgi:CubicO group peptidase (beta-lactamase class C family)
MPYSLVTQVLLSAFCLPILSLSSFCQVLPLMDTAKTGKLDIPALRTLIQNRLATDPIPSISIAVVANGQILWEEGFGWADREKQIRATAHTAYYLASVTKSITATALMLLRERNQLAFDQPVNQYLGSAQLSSPLWDTKQATVLRVATHTAGIPTFDYRCYNLVDPCSVPLDELIRRYGIVAWPPGDHFDYSNLDYGILGQMIAHTSGQPFADFLGREIFRPLGVQQASLGAPITAAANTAVRYSYQYGRRDQSTSVALGASAGYASVHDLALFSLFHLKTPLASQKRILSDTSIDSMQTQTVATGFSGQSVRYGIGWWVGRNRQGYLSVMGQGGTDDAMALVQLIPSERIGVILLANMGSDAVGQIANAALAMLLPPAAQRETESTATGQTSSAKPTALPAMLAGQWRGFIKTSKGNRPLVVSIDTSGTVHAVLAGQILSQQKKVTYSPSSQRVSLRTSGNLDVAEDTGSEPYELDFSLSVRGSTLSGTVTTSPRSYKEKFVRLSYWVEISKL